MQHSTSFIHRCVCTALFATLALSALPIFGQEEPADDKGERLIETADGIDQRLVDSENELKALQAAITAEKAPLNAELRELEEQLAEIQREFDKLSREAAIRSLEEEKLKSTIKDREKAAGFVANRFDEYIREFEAGLHIAELQRYEQTLDAAKLVMENRDLAARDRFDVQARVLIASLDRLEELRGGVSYQGSAIDGAGVLGQRGASVAGTFVQFGPYAVFSDTTGELQGFVVQPLGALLPEVVPFNMPEDNAAVKQLAETGRGSLPFDATLGEALVIEQAETGTLLDEIKLGGPVMYPILGLAGLAFLVALYKFLAIIFTPSPSRRKLAGLITAVSQRDSAKAREVAQAMRGPSGRMLQAGADHMYAPRELIEEVMYEKVLVAKLRVQRMLPFIAICAAAAPLLGLLGTVTGIINTFEMMQLSGGADMENVSGGISEALITTKFGLIVAIPTLLLHVFLSRMARRVVDQMEKAGIAFINAIMKMPPAEEDASPAAAAPPPAPQDDTPPTELPDVQDKDQEQGEPSDANDETVLLEMNEAGEPAKEDKPELVESSTDLR